MQRRFAGVLTLGRDQPRSRCDIPGDPDQMVAPQGDAALGWVSGSSPAVDEYGRAFAGYRVWPVPVGQQDQIVQAIGAAQSFVAVTMRMANQAVVLRVVWVIRPKRAGPDRARPTAGHRHPVGAEKATDNPVNPRRGGAVVFAFVATNAATPDRARKIPAREPQAAGCDHQVIGAQRICPDFLALVSRYLAFNGFSPTFSGTRSAT